LTWVAGQVTRRGKADRLICNARGVVGHNEAPVPALEVNDLQALQAIP